MTCNVYLTLRYSVVHCVIQIHYVHVHHRDVVKEDRAQNSKSMDVSHLKLYRSEGKLPDRLTKSFVDEIGVGPRSQSCSSKAFTFSTEKIRDVSIHGVRTNSDY